MAGLREMFFPADCALCGKMLLSADEAFYGICSDCAKNFQPELVPRCSLCGKPLISEKERCMACREKPGTERAVPFAFDAAFVVFPYVGKYSELCKAYKFGRKKNISRFFALKLLEARLIAPFPREAATWAPVPPRAGKIKETGWDQVEEIAKIIEKSIDVQRCLRRLPSKSQKKLGKEKRLTNLKGKILCTGKPAKDMVLFDDVFTTGSTLSVCAEELKASGAEHVYGICLFYD